MLHFFYLHFDSFVKLHCDFSPPPPPRKHDFSTVLTWRLTKKRKISLKVLDKRLDLLHTLISNDVFCQANNLVSEDNIGGTIRKAVDLLQMQMKKMVTLEVRSDFIV